MERGRNPPDSGHTKFSPLLTNEALSCIILLQTKRFDCQAQTPAIEKVVLRADVVVHLRVRLAPDENFYKVGEIPGLVETWGETGIRIPLNDLVDIRGHEPVEGGKAAIDASNDPMIQLARLVDPASREVRAAYDHQVDSVEKRDQGRIAKARFKLEGTSN